MELDELESQGTFIDFAWYSYDEDGFLPLETAFELFTNAPRHALTGAILFVEGLQAIRNQRKRDETAD